MVSVGQKVSTFFGTRVEFTKNERDVGKIAQGLNALGNALLAPTRHLMNGRTVTCEATRGDKTSEIGKQIIFRNIRGGPSKQKKGWGKAALSAMGNVGLGVLALVGTPLGAIFKGLAMISPELRERCNKAAEEILPQERAPEEIDLTVLPQETEVEDVELAEEPTSAEAEGPILRPFVLKSTPESRVSALRMLAQNGREGGLIAAFFNTDDIDGYVKMLKKSDPLKLAGWDESRIPYWNLIDKCASIAKDLRVINECLDSRNPKNVDSLLSILQKHKKAGTLEAFCTQMDRFIGFRNIDRALFLKSCLLRGSIEMKKLDQRLKEGLITAAAVNDPQLIRDILSHFSTKELAHLLQAREFDSTSPVIDRIANEIYESRPDKEKFRDIRGDLVY
jgi:hypothetical protein